MKYFILMFVSATVSAQITSDELRRGNFYDNNLTYNLPTSSEDYLDGQLLNLNKINLYDLLHLKGTIRSFTQTGIRIDNIDNKEYYNERFALNIPFRVPRLLEQYNIEAVFDQNKGVLQLSLYQASGKKVYSAINDLNNSGRISKSEIFYVLESGLFDNIVEEKKVIIEYIYNESSQLESEINISELLSSTEQRSVSSAQICGKETKKSVYKYNEQNLLVLETTKKELYLPKLEQKYPSEDIVAQQITYNNIGKISKFINPRKTVNFIYSKDNKIEAIKSDESTVSAVFKYSSAGKLSQVIMGDISMNYLFEDNNLVEIRETHKYDGNSTDADVTIHKYNKSGDKIAEQRVKSVVSDKYDIQYIYTYDDEGNWIERKDFVNGDHRATVKRKIAYF